MKYANMSVLRWQVVACAKEHFGHMKTYSENRREKEKA